MSIPGLSITELDNDNVIDLNTTSASINLHPTTNNTNPFTLPTAHPNGMQGIQDNDVGRGGQRGTGQALVQMPSSPIPPLDLGQPCLCGRLYD